MGLKSLDNMCRISTKSIGELSLMSNIGQFKKKKNTEMVCINVISVRSRGKTRDDAIYVRS